jgi:hypothetical protein
MLGMLLPMLPPHRSLLLVAPALDFQVEGSGDGIKGMRMKKNAQPITIHRWTIYD